MTDPRFPLAILLGVAAIYLAIRAVLALGKPSARIQDRLDRD